MRLIQGLFVLAALIGISVPAAALHVTFETTADAPLAPGCIWLSMNPPTQRCPNRASPGHPPSNNVRYHASSNDNGGWRYSNNPSNREFGDVDVNCYHMDVKGRTWETR
jgi:hypothetical protein